jgi:hypothetical protein
VRRVVQFAIRSGGFLGATVLAPAIAMIFFGHGDPDHNTSAPTGALANSGWQHEVFFDFTGTVVGPRHLLTAAHLNIGTNAIARHNGLAYRVVVVTNLPGTDLSLLTIGGRFPDWAPLYQRGDEAGKVATLFGRGLPRGEPVFHPTERTNGVRGWTWGQNDFRPRWGTNRVEQAFAPGVLGSSGLLGLTFSADAGDDEAAVTGGDSGGGLFLRDNRDGAWKLAGVAFSVQSRFNTGTEGDGFYASLFDRRDFLELNFQGEWVADATAADRPEAAIYFSRVSPYATTLEGLMAAASASVDSLPRLLSAQTVDGPFAEHSTYAVDPEALTITLTFDTPHRFFRLDSARPIQVQEVNDSHLTLGFGPAD